MSSLPAAWSSGSLYSRDLILKLLHINSSIPTKLPCGIIFCFTKLPISQFFDEFSNAAKCVLHKTVTATFLVSPPAIDGSHDFMLSLMFCQNCLGDLFHKASAMASALYSCLDFQQALNAYLNSFWFSFMMSNRGPLLGLWLHQSSISLTIVIFILIFQYFPQNTQHWSWYLHVYTLYQYQCCVFCGKYWKIRMNVTIVSVTLWLFDAGKTNW